VKDDGGTKGVDKGDNETQTKDANPKLTAMEIMALGRGVLCSVG
jgi:hypothetical protein